MCNQCLLRQMASEVLGKPVEDMQDVWAGFDGYSASFVPNHTMKGLMQYVLLGCPPGGFLRAVLLQNGSFAIGSADDINLDALGYIWRFCYTSVPQVAWGSAENVNKWLAKFANN